MDRAAAIEQLPAPYAVALVLHDQGQDGAIAEALDIDPAAIPALLKLAHAKLSRLLHDAQPKIGPSNTANVEPCPTHDE